MAHIFKSKEGDSFTTPAFPLSDRLRRAIWACVYWTIFRPTPRPFFAWRSFLLRCFGATIGKDAFVYPDCVIWAPWRLRIDELGTIAGGAELYNAGEIKVGHHAIVSQGAYLCTASHDYNNSGFPLVSRPIKLEPYSWVCARAVVLPGVTLGWGAVLGASAVTSKNLEPLGVYVGNPAKRVAKRDAKACEFKGVAS